MEENGIKSNDDWYQKISIESMCFAQLGLIDVNWPSIVLPCLWAISVEYLRVSILK